MPSQLKVVLAVAIAGLFSVPFRQAAIDEDASMDELFAREARIAETPADAANPNAYLTPRQRPAAPEIEMVEVRVSQALYDRILRRPSYAVKLRYRANGGERCATLRLSTRAEVTRSGAGAAGVGAGPRVWPRAGSATSGARISRTAAGTQRAKGR